MNRLHRHRLVSSSLLALAGLAVLLTSALAAPDAQAQERYSFAASALAGLGGSLDADSGDGIDNTTFQLGFAMVTEPRTLVGLRYGEIGFDDEEPLGNLFDADLSYLTLSGEYKFDEGYYVAGLFIGIGGYRLEGVRASGESKDETSIGLSLGATGVFSINESFGVLVEISGHYADLDQAQFFAMGHAGVVFRF